MGMWTKLLSGIQNFLEKASNIFEMHLYTMGNKLYATEMAKILDPKGELFAGRVLFRGDDGDITRRGHGSQKQQFGLPGPSLLEIDHDERPEDGTLASCSAVINRIHQSLFPHRSLDEVDVQNILASEQQKILGGCRILFSKSAGCFRLGNQSLSYIRCGRQQSSLVLCAQTR